jgi:hypothetical protein
MWRFNRRRTTSHDLTTALRHGTRSKRLAREPQEQVEFLDQKPEPHDDDRRAHLGQDGPFVRESFAGPAGEGV